MLPLSCLFSCVEYSFRVCQERSRNKGSGDHEAIRFALLFCEPHNEAYYQARGWHPFKGEIYAEQPVGRFTFTFTLTHGSRLNLVEGFFSKLTRSVLRHIRVATKQELKDRIMAAMDEFNRQPVVHTWSYGLDRAA